MSRVRAVWRAVGGVVAVGLVLGGCTGGDPDPDTDPVTTASVPVVESPEPSPTPTRDLTRLPERPAAMDEPTTEGAIAAATYVLDLYGYIFASGDLQPWVALTRDTCGFCAEVEAAVRAMVENGETSSGSTFVIDASEAREINDARWFSVELTITQSGSERYDADGQLIGTGSGGQHRAVFALSWEEGWRVDEMGILPVEGEGVESS